MNCTDDIKQLKTKYTSQLLMLKELFENWSEEDLLFTLEDVNGDLELAIDRISIGHVSQWDKVKPKKTKKEVVVNNTAPLLPESSTNNKKLLNTKRPLNNSSSSSNINGSRKPQPWNTLKKPVTTTTTSSQDLLKAPKKSTPKTWASLLQESTPESVTEERPVKNDYTDNLWMNNGSEDSQQWQSIFSNKESSSTTSGSSRNDLSLDFNKLKLNEDKIETRQPTFGTNNDIPIKSQEEIHSLFNGPEYSLYNGIDTQRHTTTSLNNYYHVPPSSKPALNQQPEMASHPLLNNQQTLYGNNSFYPYYLPTNQFSAYQSFLPPSNNNNLLYSSQPSLYQDLYTTTGTPSTYQDENKSRQQVNPYFNSSVYPYNQHQYWDHHQQQQ